MGPAVAVWEPLVGSTLLRRSGCIPVATTREESVERAVELRHPLSRRPHRVDSSPCLNALPGHGRQSSGDDARARKARSTCRRDYTIRIGGV